MNLQTKLVINNYKITLATLNVNGRDGILSLTQNQSQARTDTASVIVKLEGEKAVKQKINTAVEFESLRDYLAEFYVNAEYVKDWKI